MAKYYYKFLIVSGLIILTTTSVFAAELTSQKDSMALIKKLSDQTINIIVSDIKQTEKQEKMQFILSQNLDIKRISLLIAGRAIRKASEDEKSKYIPIASDYIIHKYAKLLSGYDGLTINMIDTRKIGKSDALVNVKIITSDNQPTTIGWRISNKSGELKILDVVIEGISMLRSERQQFDAIIKANQFIGLIGILQEKAVEYN